MHPTLFKEENSACALSQCTRGKKKHISLTFILKKEDFYFQLLVFFFVCVTLALKMEIFSYIKYKNAKDLNKAGEETQYHHQDYVADNRFVTKS